MKLGTLISALNLIILISLTKEFSYSSQSSWESYCSDGDSQSPIRIDTAKIDESNSEFYQLLITHIQNQEDANIVNDETTISSEGNWVEFTVSDVKKKPRAYQTEVIKFHSPAEHKIDNIQPDLEIQLIAKQSSGYSDSKTHGILSLLFVEAAGEDNEILSGFSNFIQTQNSDGSHFQNIHLSDVLFPLLAHYNSSLEYYTYQGSFTVRLLYFLFIIKLKTPPCEETVNWYIIKNYFPISTSQLAQFQSLWSGNSNFAEGDGNNRNLQSSNNREIALGKAFVAKLNSIKINSLLIILTILAFCLLI